MPWASQLGTQSSSLRFKSAEAFLAGAQIQGKQVHQGPVLSCDGWVELQDSIAAGDLGDPPREEGTIPPTRLITEQ